MDASTGAPQTPEQIQQPATGRLRMDRIVFGLIVVGVGVAWLLDVAGVSVPWRLLPAIGLILVGLALLATLLGHRGRGELIGLGIVLAVLAVIGASADGGFSGTAGDRTITPVRADWPINERLGAGTMTIDLTRNPLPRTGRLEVSVGAGRIVVLRPEDAPIRVEARVGVGEIDVNGRQVHGGFGGEWTDTTPSGEAVVLDLEVGTGSIEVRDE